MLGSLSEIKIQLTIHNIVVTENDHFTSNVWDHHD